jgi:16S rRNA (guanine966-N2)-methyltransferase
MRVIAGSAGGLHLDVPKQGVRPTMDRVKAAIFSSLGEKVIGARVLDLFAGSGALGIEALSRGAASVVFVDQDRQAVATIEKNLSKSKLRGQVRQQDVFRFLRGSLAAGSFDIILADPPYEKAEEGERFTEKILTNPILSDILANDGLLVLEKHPDESLREPGLWRLIRARKYGATEVLFLAPLGRQAAIKNRKS